ncbi:MAG: type II toxin-antitoxin system PemK/MazF family toxin [Microcoleaceae cyanobacterium]|jgi:mRNA interferase MazF
MTIPALKIGDVISARFPEQNPQGCEQEGYRPAIVVGLPSQLGSLRFPVIIVVPLTTDKGQDWATESPDLYPKFPVGTAGLNHHSIALLDQIRVLDVSRIYKYRGPLTPEEYQPILQAIQKMINP